MTSRYGTGTFSPWLHVPRASSATPSCAATIDVASRRQIGVQMATLETDETPVIIAYWIETLRAMSNKVHNVKADGSEFLDLTTAFIA